MRPRSVPLIGFGPALPAEPPKRWDDVRNSAMRTKLGTNNKPDFDYTNLGLLFPQNDESEIIYISDQMPHAWSGSDGARTAIHPHIHYIQDEAGVPIFELQYRFYNNGTAPPSFTTIDTSAGDGQVFSYSSGSLLQIIRFPAIMLVGMSSSTWYDMLLYRQTGDGVSGDVLVKGFDWHAEFDSLGSRGEYAK